MSKTKKKKHNYVQKYFVFISNFKDSTGNRRNTVADIHEYCILQKETVKKWTTGVVSGCRAAMKYHRYTLGNNREDRNDLWPFRRWFITPFNVHTFMPTVFLSTSRFNERPRWPFLFFQGVCVDCPRISMDRPLVPISWISCDERAQTNTMANTLANRRDNIYVTSFRCDDLSLNRYPPLIYSATIEGCWLYLT